MSADKKKCKRCGNVAESYNFEADSTFWGAIHRHAGGAKPVNIPNELIDTVTAAIRYAYAVSVQPGRFPPDLDLVGSAEEWRGEAEAAINAVFDSDVFARIVQEQAVLNTMKGEEK